LGIGVAGVGPADGSVCWLAPPPRPGNGGQKTLRGASTDAWYVLPAATTWARSPWIVVRVAWRAVLQTSGVWALRASRHCWRSVFSAATAVCWSGPTVVEYAFCASVNAVCSVAQAAST